MTSAGPLLVYGPRSLTYDFGPGHPLTPLRFGPAIDLLGSVGASRGLSPEPASDEDLTLCHDPAYLAIVRRLSADPDGPPAAGIGPFGDDPPFAGMDEAAASVAGGSLAAMRAILAGEVEHAFHPGGGLHHAMRDRASGFCIYDDPALAIALARLEGQRVLYVDLDVHHGDGVQTIHADDPGVMTISFHESGRSLFPGSGFLDEVGEGAAAGSVLNVPLEPWTGEGPWIDAVRAIVPGVAAAFGPDVVVSQHGCDTHAWDPLAHLRVTTTVMGEAARIVDAVAHRYARGRWLATGGGGYDAYRVVPRAWSLTWLAGAHRDVPEATPRAWRERWEEAAAAFGMPGMPERFSDAPNAGRDPDRLQLLAESTSRVVTAAAGRVGLPALVRFAIEGGWDPLGHVPAPREPSAIGSTGDAPALVEMTADLLDRVSVADRVGPIASGAVLSSLLRHLGAGGTTGVGAVVGDQLVGVTVVAALRDDERVELFTIGVAPDWRRRGLGAALLDRLMVEPAVARRPLRVELGPAERDVVDPSPLAERQLVARRLLGRAGFEEVSGDRPRDSLDLPSVLHFRRPATA